MNENWSNLDGFGIYKPYQKEVFCGENFPTRFYRSFSPTNGSKNGNLLHQLTSIHNTVEGWQMAQEISLFIHIQILKYWFDDYLPTIIETQPSLLVEVLLRKKCWSQDVMYWKKKCCL